MCRSPLRTRPGRAALAASLLVFVSWGCGGATSEPKAPQVPVAPRPTRIVVVTPPKTTGIPWDPAGKFEVRVEDDSGRGVPGVSVEFRSEKGVPEYQFNPSRTTTTDSSGIAFAYVIFGRFAGPDILSATATGVGRALVDVEIKPGPPVSLDMSDYGFELFPGETVSFRAAVRDGWNNVIPDAPFGFVVADPTLVSITPPATQGGTGTLRALRSGGTTTFTTTTLERSPIMSVRVYSKPRTACTGIATPQTLTVGVPVAVTDSTFCLAENASGAQYALMMYNESTDGATSLGTTMTGYNIESAPLTARIPSPTRSALSRFPALRRGSSAPTRDLRFHQRLLERSRSLRRLIGPARTARSFARAGSVGRIRGPSFALSGSAPSVPAVDSLVTLNVDTSACAIPDMRTFRVEAVGTHAIVLADTANPTGGFTRADYQRFAARFDTLVYPLDVGNFDAPSDIDNNGHVAILFTRAVNELTPANADYFIGGFFYSRDLFPRASATASVCPTSNEGEMFYMMVPDPAGAVNGNQFRLGFVDTLTTGVLAHEFQHLINASRRMYVNTGASSYEETWLDEGLSHTAEELLYFKEAGLSPRSYLAANAITDSWAHFSSWVSDDAANFERFYLYLIDPANHSPIDIGDDLETRGATWAFLRFAVDQSFSSDVGVWQRFANSTTTGIGTLTFALQRDPKPLLKGFAVANLKGLHPSWNFASVFTDVFVVGTYPLRFGGFQEGVATPLAAKGGSASYSRLAVSANTQALLKFGSPGTPPNSNLTFLLVREY